MAARKQFECPRGRVTASYGKTLATTSLAGKKIAPLSRVVADAAVEVAREMRLTFVPEDAPHHEPGVMERMADALSSPKEATVALVRGEPAITRQAYHTSYGLNEPPLHRIVIHTAECACEPGATDGVGSYFSSASSGGSAHYGTDPAKEGHWVHEKVIAWHAPPNQNSIGIEIAGRAAFTPTQWKASNVQLAVLRAAARTADLVHRYGIPVVWLSPHDLLAGKRGITGHVCVSQAWHQSDHTDPGPNFPVARFLALVHHFLDGLNGAVPTPAPKPRVAVVKGIQRAVHDAPVDGTWDDNLDVLATRVRDVHPASGKAAIKRLQSQLGFVGVEVDGDWGPHTNGRVHTAIVAVQKALGVPQDGDWGPKTQSAYAAARRANHR